MLFLHRESGALMSVFADDVLLAVPRARLEYVKKTLDERLTVRWGDEFGQRAWARYLRKEWRETSDGSVLVRLPVRYWQELLNEEGLENCRPVSTPAGPRSVKIEKDTLLPLDAQAHARYRRIVGKLMY